MTDTPNAVETPIPSEIWASIQTRSQQLVSDLHDRNDLFDDMDELFLLQWADEERIKRLGKNIKITKAPDPRDKLMGAMRLLIATEPEWSVRQDSNEHAAKKAASGMEKASKELMRAIGRAVQRPVHYDVVMSMLLYDEVHMAITRTADLVRYNQGGTPAAQYAAKDLARQTPYLVEVWNPKMGYPDFGAFGMNAYYREILTTSGDVWDQFGARGHEAIGGEDRHQAATLCHWWDYEWHVVWVKEGRIVLSEKHNLGFIPVVARVGQGSKLFEKHADRRQPFLYTVAKSGLWERMNLMLTAMNTNILAFLANPTFFFRTTDKEADLEVDMDTPGFMVKLGPGEEFGVVAKQAVHPEMREMMTILEQKVQESTIYAQTLGEPMGGNAPFSMVALMHQAGRLPLLVPQKASGFALADCMKIMLRWLKTEPSYDYDYSHLLGGLNVGDIPDHFDLECRLDVALPQDRLQAANAAKILSQAGPTGPTVSNRWIREELLGVGQSEDMDTEIWDEMASWAMIQQLFQMWMQQMQQREAPPQEPEGGAPVEAGAGTGVEGMPEEMATGPGLGMGGEMAGGPMGGEMPPGGGML